MRYRSLRLGSGHAFTYQGQFIENGLPPTGSYDLTFSVWSNASDRQRKTDFKEVDGRAVLAKLAALPVREWRYTNESAGVKHLGPTAQDFQTAFGLGTDDKSIGTVDADGVALAAIQGLHRKLQDKDAEIQRLQRRLERLEQLVNGNAESPR